LIESGFPAGTRATEPTGGFLVWVELPEGCDGNRLCDDALQRDITITPGSLFSPSGRHRRHIRLSACHHFSDRHVHALLTLGELAREQLGG
jgi:DNA-binding transcriptional MocR family regulator